MTTGPSLSFLQVVLDSIPILVSFVTHDERYALVNQAYESWFGIPREALIGKTLLEVIGPAAYAALSPYVRRGLAGERFSFEQYDVPYRAGGKRDIRVSFIPQPYDDGTLGYVALLEDITARRTLERERAELLAHMQTATDAADDERSKLFALFMQAPVAIAIVEGADHVYAFANPSYVALLGHRNPVGRAMLDVFPEIRGQGFDAQLDQVKRTGEALRFQAQPVVLDRNGKVERGFFDFVFAPKRNLDGIADGVLLCGFEVTEQTEAVGRAEELARQLTRSEERLRRVVESSGTGTWEIDLRTQEVTADRQFRVLCGFPPELPLTMQMALSSPPQEERAAVAAVFQRAIAGENGGRFNVDHRTIGLGDAPPRWIEARGQVIRDADGTPVRIAGTAVDIEVRKSLEAEREQVARSKDEFLAMLGHELRNPLAPIATALEVMALRDDPSSRRERAVIDRQVKHLSHLVDDLLDVSRIASGKIELRIERVDLRTVIADAIETASPMIEQRAHEMTVDASGEELVIDGDPQRLAQIVANLLTNAAKYTDPGGRIDVRASRDGDEVVLRIRDTGAGISAAMLPRVFDMFAQERQSIDRARGGLGLGLTIVRSLVAMHGGRASAHSDGIGRGSEFVIRLPAARRPTGTTAPMPVAVASAPASRRIMIVDDNADAALLLADLLGLQGHETRVAHDGPSALVLVESFVPDVAILDIGLPVMDGYELGRRMRERPSLRGMKLFALTGYGQATDRERSAAAGFDAHLVKPLKIAALRELLATSP